MNPLKCSPNRFVITNLTRNGNAYFPATKAIIVDLGCHVKGAIKNQFGCVPGILKGEFHLKLPDADDFAKMLVDLNTLVNPRLYVMDGIYAMEGNGPRGGTSRKMNIILLSSDPVALDATVCRLIKVNPECVPTVKYGMQAGMGTFLKDEIELLGDDFDGFVFQTRERNALSGI
jgi:uncharacterized protein (DUF362 family)